MLFRMSEENSKKVFSGVKLLTGAVQNYFTSPTSSGKKIINAILLVPIIVPTAITLLSAGFTWLFLNAVNRQKNDSTLSNIAKSVAKILIVVIAAAVLIPCIILNLVISLLPFLIFLAINRSKFSIVSTNQTSVNTESNPNLTEQVPNVNQVDINNKAGYDQRIREGINSLTTDPEENSEAQHGSTHNHALVNNDPHNQPVVEIISRNLEGEQAVDKTVVVQRINALGVSDGQAVVRTTQDKDNIRIKGIFAGDIPGQQTSFASGLRLELDCVPGGIGFKLDVNVRTGNNQQEATQALLQSEEVRTTLSGNGGLPSIEQYNSEQYRTT